MANLVTEQEAVRLKLEEVDRRQEELDALQESLQKERLENASLTQVQIPSISEFTQLSLPCSAATQHVRVHRQKLVHCDGSDAASIELHAAH